MMKPNDLRKVLESAIPEFRRNPEKLHLFVDEGRVVATGGKTISFEYRYTLTLIVTDFDEPSDIVMIPLLAWLRANQSELFFNPDKREHGIQFEADILNHSTVDLLLRLPLSERVTVRVEDNGYRVEHQPEPVNEHDDPSSWRPTPA